MISSHVLTEIELVCDRIGLIRDGRLIRVGTLEELRSLRVHRLEAILPAEVDPIHVQDLAGISDANLDGGILRCTVHGPITPLLAWLAANGAVELDSRELSLEQVFLAEYEPAS